MTNRDHVQCPECDAERDDQRVIGAQIYARKLLVIIDGRRGPEGVMGDPDLQRLKEWVVSAKQITAMWERQHELTPNCGGTHGHAAHQPECYERDGAAKTKAEL